ncbi:hypothetical protein EUTSA_v10008701mg [Eutrema salsugineum]|uniref:X8 domain-containing protein n=1 Tax=Eutrema salsugineum TaxID=72664 RepID=V4KZG8_EUTSA|nr:PLASMODESMATA CALLOSE-BINDING PROTEIN 1 [Eutrema salsugineum]ESQ35437.1 hypothetical protein EUTSA_v10008701mg [Eutrema salsugineum]
MRVLLALLLLLASTTCSSAIYCLCKDGIGEKELQTSIDYACGTLADCNPIREKGHCYQPNTIKSHCDWAVNSYFQKAAQVPGSCNFSGTATTNQNPPSNLVTGCIFPSSPSSAASPPSTTPPGATPTNGTTPFPGSPTNGTTPFPGSPTNGTTPFPGSPTNGTTPFPGSPTNGNSSFPGTPPVFGPTGGFNPSNSAFSLAISSVFTLCFSSLSFLWCSDLRLVRL